MKTTGETPVPRFSHGLLHPTLYKAAEAGVADPRGRSLSASWVDLDNDGRLNLYVANDGSNNAVFLNNGDGTFNDVGADCHAADYRGAMGAGSSYLPQDERVLHFGLGEVARVDTIRSVCPDGAEETHTVASSDRTLVFTHAPAMRTVSEPHVAPASRRWIG